MITRPNTAPVARKLVTVAAILIASAGAAHAGGGSTSMPWEGPLQMILDSLTGPVAGFIATVAFLAAGAVLAFGGGGDGMRKFVWAIFGVAIALGAANLVSTLFGGAGGSLIEIETAQHVARAAHTMLA